MKRSSREPDTPSANTIAFHELTVGMRIYFNGDNPPAFDTSGHTNLSFFPSLMRYAHRLVQFAFTIQGQATHVKSSCTRSDPQYPVDGQDYGDLYVIRVRKIGTEAEVVSKRIIVANVKKPDIDLGHRMLAASTDLFPATEEVAGKSLLTKQQAIDVLNDPRHGDYFLKILSAAVIIRTDQLKTELSSLQKMM